MDLTHEAFSFVEEAGRSRTASELREAFARRVRPLGFNRFVALQLTGPGGLVSQERLFGDWDPAWEAHYIGNELYRTDPILRRMLQQDEPFTWSEARTARKLTAVEARVFHDAAAFGAEEGFVVPIKHIDGSVGNVTLFAKHCDLSPQTRTALHVMALFFAGAARRLEHAGSGRYLTAREREIVRYLASGYKQQEVAEKLGVSERTVETLVTRARKRFNSRTTEQLCVEALAAGAYTL